MLTSPGCFAPPLLSVSFHPLVSPHQAPQAGPWHGHHDCAQLDHGGHNGRAGPRVQVPQIQHPAVCHEWAHAVHAGRLRSEDDATCS